MSLPHRRTGNPRFQILPRPQDPTQQRTKPCPKPRPHGIPRHKVHRRGNRDPSNGNLPGPRHTQQPGANLQHALHAKLGRLRRGLHDDAVGVALNHLRGRRRAGGHVEQLVDGAAPLLPLRAGALEARVAHGAELRRDLLALLLGDAGDGVACRPGDAESEELDDDAWAEDEVVVRVGALELPFVQADVAEGRGTVEDELVAVGDVGGCGRGSVAGRGPLGGGGGAADYVEVLDAGGDVEVELWEVDLPADEEEELVDLAVVCGVVDLALEMVGGCDAEG